MKPNKELDLAHLSSTTLEESEKVPDVSIAGWALQAAEKGQERAQEALKRVSAKTSSGRKEQLKSIQDEQARLSKIVERLMEPPSVKKMGLKTLDRLELPHYRKRASSVDQVLNSNNIDLLLPPSESGQYYVSIIKHNGKRFFKFGIAKNEIQGFVAETKKQHELLGRDTVTLSEYLTNTYSANIVIHSNEHLRVELIKGKHADLAYYGKHPELTINTDPFLGLSKVSHCEFAQPTKELCLSLIWRAIGMIPRTHYSDRHDLRFAQDPPYIREPGYYEVIFSLVGGDQGGHLPDEERYVTKFLDYRPIANYATELESLNDA